MPALFPNGPLIKQLHDRLEKRANNALREKGLTMMQVSVLLALQEREKKQLSMKELEQRFQIAQPTVVGIVARLEQKGFVEAIGDIADKRIKVARITAAGEACCKDAVIHMQETEERLLRGFSEEEKGTLNALLLRASKNMK